jgi:hypothetical protein
MFDRVSDPLHQGQLFDIAFAPHHDAFGRQVKFPAPGDDGSHHVPAGPPATGQSEPIECHDAVDTAGEHIVDDVVPGDAAPRQGELGGAQHIVGPTPPAVVSQDSVLD